MESEQDPDTPQKLLTRAQLLSIIPVSYATLWSWMRAGQFPRALKVGPTRVMWIEAEVREWIATRERQTLLGDSDDHSPS
ncbi:MAG TPA: AlpA family phage regulatory protein [Alphaproteobacteria bacterium]|nr:AlpA family phage regulatory protein [Alphaproteobacteria bacterium]